MLKFLRTVLIAVALVAIAVGATASYVLKNPNRFKPRLEALIEEQTGVPLRIGGDLDWQLWPPVSITAEDLSADYQGQQWTVRRLTLDLDAIAAVRDPAQWRVQALTIDGATMHQHGAVLTVSRARLEDLSPNRRAPVSARLTYAAEGQPPVPVNLNGQVSVDPDTLAMVLRDTRIETSAAEGTCNVQAQPATAAVAAAPATTGGTADELIPVDVFRTWSWSGECRLDWLQLDDQRFADATVDLSNDAGDSALIARLPHFFGGEAVADLAIDARATPVKWILTPTLTDVNSSELMSWLDQRLQWVANVAYGGSLTFEGNSVDDLASSLSGATRFDGGHGSIDIARIRNQLVDLATLFNEGDRIRRWPEVWDYKRFVGDWRIDHQHHHLDATLDNLALTAEGDYDPVADDMNMLLTLVFGNDPSLPIFDLDPVLYDLPIPVRCRGSLQDPSCKVDDRAAQRIVAAALSGEDSELRAKLEKKIDEQVPEQYRDAARSLLDALGSSLESSSKDH